MAEAAASAGHHHRTEETGDRSTPASLFSTPGGVRPPRDVLNEMLRGTGRLRVVSLNLGGRNTNPFEFELKGDNSEIAQQAMAMLRRAGKALPDARHGPLHMPAAEREIISQIVAELFRGAQSELHAEIVELFRHQTWTSVLSWVSARNPHLFNALNLSTLKLRRPSVWEDPGSCAAFRTSLEYLAGWQRWYRGLDRSGHFWLVEAPRTAKKRNLDVASAFAGLLLFDVMCLCAARCVLVEQSLDMWDNATHEVPFRKIADFASDLPASSLTARHTVAAKFIRDIGAHVVLAQEARMFADFPFMAEAFLPPIYGLDGFTAVFLRRGRFSSCVDISEEVHRRLAGLVDGDVKEQKRKAWMTTANRLAAVHCQCDLPHGGFDVCFVSLHASQSESTADFLVALRAALAGRDAELNVVGMDSNCSGKEAAAFQRQLRSAGFELGRLQDQVTVAKQRSHFQTQVRKAGQADVSHKDYVVSWGSPQMLRGETVYTPDLHTAYGVEQETKQCMRLPTTKWPFDHCSVAASFKPKRGCNRSVAFRRQALLAAAVLLSVLFVLLIPLASGRHKSPYGPPGMWLHDNWPGTPRVGICEAKPHAAEPPCGSGWISGSGSCYQVTPRLAYDDADRFCQAHGGHLVSIGSEDENQLLVDTWCPRGEFCWIGLRSDIYRIQVWWANGEGMNYTRLVGAKRRLFPLFPLSRDTDREVAVLSAFHEEIDGCRTVDFLAAEEDLPDDLVIFRSVGIGVTVFVSTLLLVLPRPTQTRTSMYLLLAFIANFLWYVSTMYGYCFAASLSSMGLAKSAATVADVQGHGLTAIWSCWIILKRISLLYPAKFPRTVFKWLIVCWVMASLTAALFLDVATTMDASSPPVVISLSLIMAIVVLYLLFCAPIASKLYQTWKFMEREARTGRSSEGDSELRRQVRSAQIHLFSVLAAITTGAAHWLALFLWTWASTKPGLVLWPKFVLNAVSCADSIANDLCAFVLVALHMDDSVARAKGITSEVAKRATLEVEQHQLAVRLLKAAPTSQGQLRQLARLEMKAIAECQLGQENENFLLLKLAVQVESARIHRLMWCVRVRAMTMPLRYQYLMDVPALHDSPRQHVPTRFVSVESAEAAREYFDWLYAEADEAWRVFLHQVKQLVTTFNRTPWPSDLGLVVEQFPWTIWPNGAGIVARRRLQNEELANPGDILIHTMSQPLVAKPRCLGCVPGRTLYTPCVVLEEEVPSRLIKIHCSGAEEPEEVGREELRAGAGGAVLIPGPKKKWRRCIDKIEADYEDKEPWPAAASLLDICRCMIVLDDPYAIAVLVAHIRNTMKVVRLKNRFAEDAFESISPEELQSMFYSASQADASSSGSTSTGERVDERHYQDDRQYRDVSMNVEIMTPSGVPFICEIQVTLSDLAMLKRADTKLYSLRRMQSPQELQATHVFSGIEQTDTASLTQSAGTMQREASLRSMSAHGIWPSSAHSLSLRSQSSAAASM